MYEHIYYKEYFKEDNDLVEVPEKRSIYAIRFDQPFAGDYVKKYFGLAGKIQTAHMGEYKHKANNKKKRRQLWFAIVIYKKAEDCEKALSAKWLQKEITKTFGDGKGKWKITFNPGQEEEEDKNEEGLPAEEKERREKVRQMEAEGFTVMEPAKGKRYVSDGATSMKFITKGMIDQMMQKDKKEEEPGFEFYEESSRKKKKLAEGEKGFYMYETKEQKKRELNELRKGLDEDMKKIEMMKGKEVQNE